jgi:aminopeptidase-like protein
MKAFWRSSKDGFVFVYAINNKQSFKDMIEDIIDIKSNPVYKNVQLNNI